MRGARGSRTLTRKARDPERSLSASSRESALNTGIGHSSLLPWPGWRMVLSRCAAGAALPPGVTRHSCSVPLADPVASRPLGAN